MRAAWLLQFPCCSSATLRTASPRKKGPACVPAFCVRAVPLWGSRTRLLRKAEFHRCSVICVAHLRIVERRKTERVLGAQVGELHVVLASRHELARQRRSPHAVLVTDRGVDVATVAGELGYEYGRYFVPGDELAVVERDFVFRSEIVRASLVRGLAVLAHELGFAVDELDVLVASARFRITLAAGVGGLVLVITRMVYVLIVGLADVAGAYRFHVPEICQLAFARGVLVAERLAGFAGVA